MRGARWGLEYLDLLRYTLASELTSQWYFTREALRTALIEESTHQPRYMFTFWVVWPPFMALHCSSLNLITQWSTRDYFLDPDLYSCCVLRKLLLISKSMTLHEFVFGWHHFLSMGSKKKTCGPQGNYNHSMSCRCNRGFLCQGSSSSTHGSIPLGLVSSWARF